MDGWMDRWIAWGGGMVGWVDNRMGGWLDGYSCSLTPQSHDKPPSIPEPSAP